jgi:antitoxin (DNA-binding transcriptional repressor) of toxin-antitoxin stability system
MSTRTIPVSEFTAHPDADLARVESGDLTIELTRDGKVIAIITPPEPEPSGTIADWIGSGVGFTLAPGCTLEDPAFEPEDWEEFPGSDDLLNPIHGDPADRIIAATAVVHRLTLVTSDEKLLARTDLPTLDCR